MGLQIRDGVWVTMVTPFTEEGKIDYDALEKLVEWYLGKEVAGLFAVCKSSESFELTMPERLDLASFVVKAVGSKIPVIAGGNFSEGLDRQIEEMRRMADTGVDAVVLIASMAAAESESDDIWLENVETILNRLHDSVRLGIYECPYPYKKIMKPELLKWCIDTGRFQFLKDTCCDIDLIRQKLEITKGSNLKIFNAQTATLLESLQAGCAGYSSIMSNIVPELYNWLILSYAGDLKRAQSLQEYLAKADNVVTHGCYPMTAKYYLRLEGIPMSLYTRRGTGCRFDDDLARTLEQLHQENRKVTKEYGV